MKTIYGNFSKEQIDKYKDRLHSKLFQLLLYKDPETKDKYNVNFEKYFSGVMHSIDGLNELLFYPEVIVEVMSNLEAAFMETRKENFDYKVYRKLVLDAHALVDHIGEEG